MGFAVPDILLADVVPLGLNPVVINLQVSVSGGFVKVIP